MQQCIVGPSTPSDTAIIHLAQGPAPLRIQVPEAENTQFSSSDNRQSVFQCLVLEQCTRCGCMLFSAFIHNAWPPPRVIRRPLLRRRKVRLPLTDGLDCHNFGFLSLITFARPLIGIGRVMTAGGCGLWSRRYSSTPILLCPPRTPQMRLHDSTGHTSLGGPSTLLLPARAAIAP
jgi:hypothetical protein